MKYVMKVSNTPGGLQVSEQYKTLSVSWDTEAVTIETENV